MLLFVFQAPCPPKEVTSQIDYTTNIVTLEWQPGRHANTYTATAIGNYGHVTSCQSTNSSCQFKDLRCGEKYNFSIIATDGNCDSIQVMVPEQETAPCIPQNMGIILDCDTNIALASWDRSKGALGYTAMAQDVNGKIYTWNTTDTSCSMAHLQCGLQHSITVKALSANSNSAISNVTTFQTVPCTPLNIETHLDCSTNIPSVTWDHSKGAMSYRAIAESSTGHTTSCNTSDNNCDISFLQCGQKYNISVVAEDNKCGGFRSSFTEIETAPCPPENVAAVMDCNNKTATVSWSASERAVSYNVSAEENGEQISSCSTQDTSCHLSDLQCGRTYDVTVTPIGRGCTGFKSSAFKLFTGPCPPMNVEVKFDCLTKFGSVSWDLEPGAQVYVATATEDDGHTHTCTTNSTECVFMDLHCGSIYIVTAVAINGECSSANSLGSQIKTAPCTPEIADVQLYCEGNLISVLWDQTEGARSYVLSVDSPDGKTASLVTNDTSQDVVHLQCGTIYMFWLTAQGEMCNTSMMHSVKRETAPCPPRNVQAEMDCGLNTGNITWEKSNGAQSYIAVAEGVHGHLTSCNSIGTSCDMKLDCGQLYRITVVAANNNCNSSNEKSINIASAPCLPQNVQAELDCSSNSLSVQWQQSSGAESYTAMAIGSNGVTATCNTTDTTCNISSLECGLTYSIAVTSSSLKCNIIKGSDYKIQSAPCMPEGISTQLDCATNIIAVSWNSSKGAISYMVIAETSDGKAINCTSSGTACELLGAQCGDIYSITVHAADNKCSSLKSPEMFMKTVPCVPEHLNYNLDCETNIAMVRWDYSMGSLWYVVEAKGKSNHSTNCSSQDTNCNLSDFLCGQTYTVTVTAEDSTCRSAPSSAIDIKAAPCKPHIISTHLDCVANSIFVNWETSDGATFYLLNAEEYGGSVNSFNTTESHYDLMGLNCGQKYFIRVVASDDACASSESLVEEVVSEPCMPQNVHAIYSANMAEVGWDHSLGAGSYTAEALSILGHWENCETTDTRCKIEGLLCGEIYNVTVSAHNDVCNSTISEVKVIETEPCPPQNVVVDVDCEDGLVSVSWEESANTESYIVTAEKDNVLRAMCHISGTSCHIPDLECGQVYALSVRAQNAQGNSSESSVVYINTAPCLPAEFDAVLNCNNNNTAWAFWSPSHGAEYYTVSAQGADGQSVSCNTTDSSCNLTDLHCGEMYNLSMIVSDEQCQRFYSVHTTVTTVPCIPFHISADLSCDNQTALVTWDASEGAESYHVTAWTDSGDSRECHSTGLACDIRNLQCGQTYHVAAVAVGSECRSEQSPPEEIQTAPCIPQDVSTTSDCLKNHGLVYWTESDGAVFYTAIAQGLDGHQHICNTEETSCNWTDLHCGEVYNVFVMAHDYSCNSSVSNTSTIVTGPCTPQNFGASAHCSLNGILVSWDASEGAAEYQVTAQDANGFTAESRSNITSCDLTELPCGEIYSATVTALSNNCLSPPSSKVYFKTGPCPPIAVSVQPDCSGNSSLVRWTESNGALYYMATAETTDDTKRFCTSVGTQCEINGLQCGQLYYINVVAVDYQCNSTEVPFTEVQTAPCRPQNVSVQIDCATNSSLVSWVHAAGAINYTATAQSNSGKVYSCTTDGQECELQNLPCGQLYMVQVVAMDNTCSSLPSTAVNIQTAPCVPKISEVFLDCLNNTFLVQWSQSEGAIDYTVTATAPNEHIVGCSSNSTNCEIGDLMCSQLYSIRVMAFDDQCNSSESTSWYMETVPCVPQIVQTRLDCNKKGAFVQWNPVDGAQLYVVNATSNQGDEATCTTNKNFCEMTELQCGSIYNVSVTAANQLCDTSQSEPEELKSGYVTATNDCDTGTVTVSWEESSGATFYTVMAHGSRGYLTTCNATGTECQLTDLLCSHSYNITVTATDDMCTSLESHPVTLDTALCAPQNVEAFLECSSNTAYVSWEMTTGAAAYVVFANSSNNYDVSCNTTDTFCMLHDLHCGEKYNVTVLALDNICDNIYSASVEIRTGPCPPENVVADIDCYTGIMSVRWDSVPGATFYAVQATAGEDNSFSCNGTDTTCGITGLPCGLSLTVTTTSSYDDCQSTPSQESLIATAPCTPLNVKGYLDCVTNAAWVSWSQADGAEIYNVTAISSGGHQSSCTSTNVTCGVPDLQCGNKYTFSVTAISKDCLSMPSAPFDLETAPCILNGLTLLNQCNSSTINVLWNRTESSQLYIATAEGSDGSMYTCNSTKEGCNLNSVNCGTEYTIIVAATSDKCSSLRSPPSKITTGVMNVSWSSSPFAEFYMATIMGVNGAQTSCNTSGTTCTFADLVCGQTYEVSVTASHERCRSPPNLAISVNTVPCAPEGLNIDMQCESSSALLSWMKNDEILEYYASATLADGEILWCTTQWTGCTINELACGSSYNFALVGFDGTCNSSFSNPITQGAVPCPPENVTMSLGPMTKSTQELQAVWSEVQCAEEYMLEVHGLITGDPESQFLLTSYWTTDPYFYIPLLCSSVYNVSMISRNVAGIGDSSVPVQGLTAPCTPNGITVDSVVDGLVVVSWNASIFATEYWLLTPDDSTLCKTSQLSCELPINISSSAKLVAVNSAGESEPSESISLTSSHMQRKRRDLHEESEEINGELLPPQLHVLSITNDTLHVEWTATEGATHYLLIVKEVTASKPFKPIVQSVQETSAKVSGLQPFTNYKVVVSAKDSTRSSAYSDPVFITTGRPLCYITIH
ncbi:FNDC7 protein, partial [Polypterus senegalus]